uniref:Uncharacterized protein n=1 Tax=Glossina pallidipes TaxID=7398 RepID=A0A1A9ZW83_GLOPL
MLNGIDSIFYFFYTAIITFIIIITFRLKFDKSFSLTCLVEFLRVSTVANADLASQCDQTCITLELYQATQKCPENFSKPAKWEVVVRNLEWHPRCPLDSRQEGQRIRLSLHLQHLPMQANNYNLREQILSHESLNSLIRLNFQYIFLAKPTRQDLIMDVVRLD